VEPRPPGRARFIEFSPFRENDKYERPPEEWITNWTVFGNGCFQSNCRSNEIHYSPRVSVDTSRENVTASELHAANLRLSIDLLQSMKPQEIDLILAAARSRRFSAKAVMTHQGEPADHLLLLRTGRARYFYETPHGRKIILRWITPGQVFAAAALISRPSTYLVSTEAVRDSVVLVWDGPTIRVLARRFPRVLENVLILAMDHFTWYVAAHAALASETARQRLANVLLGLAPKFGQTVSHGVELDATNEELANSANISPYSASRIISEWQKAGAIRKYRGKILLRSPQKLFLRVV
jgi:CRP/FNR family transcriptional regulator, nitrogen oxide reductase regulator